jgi:hypothetical protein
MEKLVLLAALISTILAMAKFPDGLTVRPLAKAKHRRGGRSFG